MGLRRSLVEGAGAARRAPLVQTVAVSTIAVSLLLLGLVRLIEHNVGRLADSWGKDAQIIIYLDDEAAPARAQKIADAARRLPGVASARTVTGAEAHARLAKSLGERAALLDGIEDDLLPTSVELSFHDGVTDTAGLTKELDRLRHAPGVEDVERMGDWVDRLVAIQRLLALAGFVLGALVAAACIFVVVATIRLGVYARRDEIEILKLCGATDGFVKAPFVVEGALQGSCGAALALGLLYGLFRAVAPHVEHTLGSALCAVPLTFLPTHDLAVAVPIGAVLGLVGSFVAVGRYVEV